MGRWAAVLLAAVVASAPAAAGDGLLRAAKGPPPAAVDLSAEGTADGAHWGLVKGATVLHRKAGGRPLVGDLDKVGGREAHTRAVGRTRSGLFTDGKGNGFRVAVPAYTDVTAPDPKGEILNVVHTLTYRAAADGRALTLTWTNPGDGGNVEFMAVTLADGEPKAAPGPAFPLRAGDTGRYLVDRTGAPFFVHADTGWRAVMALTVDEAKRYLDDRKAKGFTAVHLHAINKEMTGPATRDGHHPFDPKDDLTTPNEAYWRHADAVLEAVAERGLLAVVSASWFGYNGSGWRKQVTPEAAREYGRFLGRRYKRFPNILWVHVGDNNPGDKAGAVAELARAIKAEAPHHLHAAHNHPENSSAAQFGDADWLDVNFAYTYKEAHVQVAAEYARAGKARPVYLVETGYEGEKNTGFVWTPTLVRRQPYRALLAGACGHANGSATIWHFGPGWDKALDMEATRQMAHVKRLFAALPWWELVPDPKGELVAAGRGTPGGADEAVAARTADGRYALVYLPTPRPVTVDLGRVAGGRVTARWYNPRDGMSSPPEEVAGGGRREFRPPTAGPEDDWVLVLHAADAAFDPAAGR